MPLILQLLLLCMLKIVQKLDATYSHRRGVILIFEWQARRQLQQ